MQREGACTSLWQYKTDDYQAAGLNASGIIADALVVGGGITGVTTALLYRSAGN